jgi:hypothetical protein
MKSMVISPLLLQLLLAPVFTFAQLTAEERAFERKCYDNILRDKKQLSVATALECVKRLNEGNGALLAKLREDSPEMREAVVPLVSWNNALIDLKNIVSNNSGNALAKHLRRVLEDIPCPLCHMGLGPESDKIFDWVGKEAQSCLPEVKRSVHAWESLGPIRTQSLSSADYNIDQAQWAATSITGRRRLLAIGP